MNCLVRYTHPVTGNCYYFVDLRSKEGEFKPVGCMRHKKANATVFSTKREAEKLCRYLLSLGYVKPVIIRNAAEIKKYI